jgi:hypothetical protein
VRIRYYPPKKFCTVFGCCARARRDPCSNTKLLPQPDTLADELVHQLIAMHSLAERAANHIPAQVTFALLRSTLPLLVFRFAGAGQPAHLARPAPGIKLAVRAKTLRLAVAFLLVMHAVGSWVACDPLRERTGPVAKGAKIRRDQKTKNGPRGSASFASIWCDLCRSVRDQGERLGLVVILCRIIFRLAPNPRFAGLGSVPIRKSWSGQSLRGHFRISPGW